MTKKCCVLSEKDKKLLRIQDIFSLLPGIKNQLTCQFARRENEPLYEYEQSFYCLLHLPMEGKKKLSISSNQVNEYLKKLIEEKHINFNFISLWSSEIRIYNNNTNLTFFGSHLRNFFITSNSRIGHLDFYGSLIDSDKNKFFQIYLDRCDFKKVEVKGRIEFSECEIETFFIFESQFVYPDPSVKNGLVFKETRITDFQFRKNKVFFPIDFEKGKIKNLEICESEFHIPPAIHDTEINNLLLPKKNDYVKNFNNAEYLYKRYRNLYNLLRGKGMRHEMDDYYYMEKRCFENIKNENFWLKLSTKCYRWFSDYGQNIGKPIIGLFILLIFSICINNFFFNLPPIVSIKNIFFPFYLLKYSNVVAQYTDYIYFSFKNVRIEITWIAHLLLVAESILTILFVALLLITLRWKFKKE